MAHFKLETGLRSRLPVCTPNYHRFLVGLGIPNFLAINSNPASFLNGSISAWSFRSLTFFATSGSL